METQQQEHTAPLRPTSLEDARAMVAKTIKQIPQLSTFGIDSIEMTGTFDQRSLCCEKSLRMVGIAADWFRAQLGRSHWVRKSLDHRLTSYVFKTAVEGACGRYISNGSIICAAVGLGLAVETRALDPNATIRLVLQETTGTVASEAKKS